VARTLVVVGVSGVVPPAAVPVLRAARRVVADGSVPAALRAELGAEPAAADLDDPADPGEDDVLLTAAHDPADPRHAAADSVVGPPPGAALLDAVAVMHRLRSPGGCPWDAEQTHESLLQYLVEECYELYQAVEDGDRAALREELGDVLLQVLFHARVAQEGAPAFGIDEVAADLVAKLVGRHPHVFAGTETVDTAERQEHRWEELKRAEKQRTSSTDGVATAQPAVALAAKLTSRTARAGLPPDLLPTGPGAGERLFALAAAVKREGADPEALLRTAARRFAADVRAAETAATAAGLDPHALGADDWRRYWPDAGPAPRP
jgi:XTP/dITP diphosphohydrolase